MATHIHEPELHMYDVDGHTLTEVATHISGMAEAGRAEWFPHMDYEYDGGVVTAATVTIRLRKTMPRWHGYTHASEPVKAEWDRFWHALDAHEGGHFELVTCHLGSVHAQLVGQSVADAQRVFDEAVQALNDASAGYDSQTNHGLAQGTNIDVSVENQESVR